MNRSEELAKLLGIEPKEINCRCEIEKDYECKMSNWDDSDCPCIHELIYPDFTNPSNFVKLLGCLHKVGLTTSFFRSEISTIQYCCEIEDCYMYENRPDFGELFCEQNENNYQSALVDTLINIYEREWVCGISDKHFFCELEETLTELQNEAQQTEWTY